MIVPTFVDLQGFIVGSWFVVKEVAVLKKGSVLSHYIFANPLSMGSTYKIRKVLRFLVDCESSWIAMENRDDSIQHGKTSYYIGCG